MTDPLFPKYKKPICVPHRSVFYKYTDKLAFEDFKHVTLLP